MFLCIRVLFLLWIPLWLLYLVSYPALGVAVYLYFVLLAMSHPFSYSSICVVIVCYVFSIFSWTSVETFLTRTQISSKSVLVCFGFTISLIYSSSWDVILHLRCHVKIFQSCNIYWLHWFSFCGFLKTLIFENHNDRVKITADDVRTEICLYRFQEFFFA